MVLVEDGSIVTNATKTVTFDFAGSLPAESVTISNSGLGTIDLGTLSALCPANLTVTSWVE